MNLASLREQLGKMESFLDFLDESQGELPIEIYFSILSHTYIVKAWLERELKKKEASLLKEKAPEQRR